MHTSPFFKLFPPPKFLIMKHAGLDISDDAIRCIQYTPSSRGLAVEKHGAVELPDGLVDGGDVKDEKAFAEILKKFDDTYDLSYVKVSVPEEKAYLFETEVPKADVHAIGQNIEFKLEENVPLSAPDAVFYFDLMPGRAAGGSLRASVSVVPRTYIEKRLALLRQVGMSPIAFEIAPKSIARAVVPPGNSETWLIVHIMDRKTGLYVVSGGIVLFTSTVGWGVRAGVADEAAATLSREIGRVHSYWVSRASATIGRIMLVGRGALACERLVREAISGVPVGVAEVWRNALNLDRYIPPISRDDSLDYAVAAGLAMGS